MGAFVDRAEGVGDFLALLVEVREDVAGALLVVEEGEGGEGLGAAEPARRSSTSAWGSPRPRRRRRTASVQAASRARRQRPGMTRRAASGGRPSVLATAIASSM